MTDTLTCDHCGNIAVFSDADGAFYEDQASSCISCDYPGEVAILWDEGDEDAGFEHGAAWRSSENEDATCTAEDCEACR